MSASNEQTGGQTGGDERRRAPRLILNTTAVIRPISQPTMRLHPELAKVYERVDSNSERVGSSFPAVIRDISVGGAFIVGEAMPLLSRLRMTFELDGYGEVEAIGWVLWRRKADCAIPGPDGQPMDLPRGFGVLFEAIPLEARIAIHNLVVEQAK